MDTKAPALANKELTTPLTNHQKLLKNKKLAELFDEDCERFSRFLVECGDLKIDLSKNIIDKDSLSDLTKLADYANLKDNINALFNGAEANNTEHRAALHSALRCPIEEAPPSVANEIKSAREKLFTLATKINSGEWLGYDGKPITDIINIGIGGSDLGPAMTVTALDAYKKNPSIKFHFVSNVDPTDITQALNQCSPSTTLFIVASKTFSTLETLSNAHTAKKWFQAHAGDAHENIKHHFIAVSTNIEKAREFGIEESSILPMWDWVGGRYSIWSTIALPLCIAIGEAQFSEFLEGAHQIDKHFRGAPTNKNAPALLALLSIWYSEFFGTQSHGILCYEHYLEKFPSYLQQLDMESNGKCVTKNGDPVTFKTGIPIWGNVGSNSQHSFHQLLHQGTVIVPVDFIVGIESCNPQGNQQTQLFSNCLAQSQALMLGRHEPEIRKELEGKNLTETEIENLIPHKTVPGNKPSTTIIYPKMTPSVLGQLIALYEHKVFAQSVIWNINPFDQWGVELGKQLSAVITSELESDSTSAELDQSTKGLIEIFKQNNAS